MRLIAGVLKVGLRTRISCRLTTPDPSISFAPMTWIGETESSWLVAIREPVTTMVSLSSDRAAAAVAAGAAVCATAGGATRAASAVPASKATRRTAPVVSFFMIMLPFKTSCHCDRRLTSSSACIMF